MQVYNDYVLMARDVSVDSRDNMMSIFKMIDKFNFSLTAEEYKKFTSEVNRENLLFPARFILTSSWSLDKPVNKSVSVILESKIADSSGKELASTSKNAEFTKGTDRVRFNAETEGLPVSGKGRYTIELIMKSADSKKILSSGTASFQVAIEQVENTQ